MRLILYHIRQNKGCDIVPHPLVLFSLDPQPCFHHQGLRFVELADCLIKEGLAFAFNLQPQVIDGVDGLVQQRGCCLVFSDRAQCSVSSSSVVYARAMLAAWCMADDSMPIAVLPSGL